MMDAVHTQTAIVSGLARIDHRELVEGPLVCFDKLNTNTPVFVIKNY